MIDLPQQRPHHDISALFAEAHPDFLRVSAPSKLKNYSIF